MKIPRPPVFSAPARSNVIGLLRVIDRERQPLPLKRPRHDELHLLPANHDPPVGRVIQQHLGRLDHAPVIDHGRDLPSAVERLGLGTNSTRNKSNKRRQQKSIETVHFQLPNPSNGLLEL